MNAQNIYQQYLNSLYPVSAQAARFYTEIVRAYHYFQKPTGRELAALYEISYLSPNIYLEIPPLVLKMVTFKQTEFFAQCLQGFAQVSFSCAQRFTRLFLKTQQFTSLYQRQIQKIIHHGNQEKDSLERALDFLIRTINLKQGQYTDKLLQSVIVILRQSPAFMKAFSELIEKLSSEYDPVQFNEWFAAGLDLIASGRIELGHKHFLGETTQAKRILGVKAAYLDTKKFMLKIYLESISHVPLQITNYENSGFGLRCPFTDGNILYLPEKIDLFASEKANEKIYILYTAMVSAQLRFQTFSLNLEKLDFIADVKTKYGNRLPPILESLRNYYGKRINRIRDLVSGNIEVTFLNNTRLEITRTQFETFYFLFPAPNLIRYLFQFIENARVESLLCREYEGYKKDFLEWNTFLYNNRNLTVEKELKELKPIFQVLEAFVQNALRGKHKIILTNEKSNELLYNIIHIYKKIQQSEADVQTSAQVTYEIFELLFEQFNLVRFERLKLYEKIFSNYLTPGIMPELVYEINPALMPEDNEEFFTEDVTTDKVAFNSVQFVTQQGQLTETLKGLRNYKLYQYSEWDFKEQKHLKNHCLVIETYSEGLGTTAQYDSVLLEYKKLATRFQKKFLMLKKEEFEYKRKYLTGDEAHLDDLVQYTLDILMNTTPEDKIYARRIKNKRDLVTGILVDISSSTLEHTGFSKGKSSKRVIDIEIDALTLISHALSALGDVFGIFSFFSRGRGQTFFQIVKDFHENINHTVKSRIGAIQPSAANRDGAAIRHLSQKLLNTDRKTKLLLMITDGMPDDVGYGTQVKKQDDVNEYAIEDTRKAILEARRAGIHPYCITISRRTKRYLPHMYGLYNFSVIPDVNMLPQRLPHIYEKLTLK